MSDIITNNHIYKMESRVRFSEIDHTGKMTLPAVINYFQDCSIFQSEAIGYGLDVLREKKHAWVLTSWQIEIERYPGIGEQICVKTFATKFRGILGERNFILEDEAGRRIACADSLWVYMDLEKGRPARPDPEEIKGYGTAEPISMEPVSRKIELPEAWETYPAFPVRKYHIDTNEHVNNCQYIQMALELLGEDKPVKRMRAEYKKSAVYQDVIQPKAAVEADRTVVQLEDKDGSAYVVVEFR